MKDLAVVLHVFNTLVGLTLVVSTFVLLNYTYTHADLPDDNVRFYKHDDPANLTEGGSGRYQLLWWLTATHALRWLVPFAAAVAVLTTSYGNSSVNLLALVVVGILTFVETAKGVWQLFMWVGPNCEDYQICRNTGARRDAGGAEIGDDPRQQSGTYTFDVFYTLAIVVMWFLYLIFVLGRLRGALDEKRREKEQSPLPADSPAAIAAKEAAKLRPRAGHAVATSVVSLVLVLALVVYLPWVHQNLTFTQGARADTVLPPDQQFNQPDDTVPHFVHDVPGDPTEGASGRGELYWWVFASDALLGLVPLAVMGNLVDRMCGRSGFVRLAQAFMLVLWLWTAAKLFWLALLALPTLCDGFQFCRPFDARRDAGGVEIGANASNMNFVHALAAWFQLGFLVLLTALLVLVSTLPGASGRAAVMRRMTSARKGVGARVQTAASAAVMRGRSFIAGNTGTRSQRAVAKEFRRQQ